MPEALGPSAEWLQRARARMDHVLSLSPELRALVDEYGYTIVRAFLDLRCRVPAHIERMINAIQDRVPGAEGVVRSYAKMYKWEERHVQHIVGTVSRGNNQGWALLPEESGKMNVGLKRHGPL